MKIITTGKLVVFLAAVFFNGTVSAYTDDKPEEYCKKPKFTDLNFKPYSEPEKAEVAPETELKLRLSENADPKSLVLTIKQQVIKTTIESNSSFHRVSFKIPAAFAGGFVRINAHAKANLSLKCDEDVGWLVKVSSQ
jgi:hypothetical protein